MEWCQVVRARRELPASLILFYMERPGRVDAGAQLPFSVVFRCAMMRAAKERRPAWQRLVGNLGRSLEIQCDIWLLGVN